MVLETVHRCGGNEATATFCYNVVGSVREVVAKDDKYFFWATFLILVTRFQVRNPTPILKYQKEKEQYKQENK